MRLKDLSENFEEATVDKKDQEEKVSIKDNQLKRASQLNQVIRHHHLLLVTRKNRIDFISRITTNKWNVSMQFRTTRNIDRYLCICIGLFNLFGSVSIWFSTIYFVLSLDQINTRSRIKHRFRFDIIAKRSNYSLAI